jgi:hypothetical protein
VAAEPLVDPKTRPLENLRVEVAPVVEADQLVGVAVLLVVVDQPGTEAR